MTEKNIAKKKKIHRKTILKSILLFLLVIAALAALLILYLTITEYKPKDTVSLSIDQGIEGNAVSADSNAAKERGRDIAEKLPAVRAGSNLAIVTWNIGYGALGDNADFFMDGGHMVSTADKSRVQKNIHAINDELKTLNSDFVFLQEVDMDASRSHHINEVQSIRSAAADRNNGNGSSTFAYNFKVNFIPYPIPPIGKVESGILTLSQYAITDSQRIQLPCPFKWPIRIANLKRCLMLDRIPVKNAAGKKTGKDLVLINLHLEAYDSGEGKTAQTAMLRKIIQTEADKGNYVIAGGDFNQTFSETDDSMYPEYKGRWHCGEIDQGKFSKNWDFLMDNRTPTCRSLDQSFKGKNDDTFQFYMIDGFIVSSNIHVKSIETKNLEFRHSDHNPVKMVFRISQE